MCVYSWFTAQLDPFVTCAAGREKREKRGGLLCAAVSNCLPFSCSIFWFVLLLYTNGFRVFSGQDVMPIGCVIKTHKHLTSGIQRIRGIFKIFIHWQQALLHVHRTMPLPPSQLLKLPPLPLQQQPPSPGISCTADCRKESVRNP